MVINTELIKACQRKENSAQKQLYSILLPYLNVVCKRYINNPSDLQDVLQEAFIRIFSSIEIFEPSKGQFKTWTVRITINCALKHNAKMKRIQTDELSPEQHVQLINPAIIKKLTDEDFIAFVKKMPQKYYEVFNLHIIDGFSHKEIGQLLNRDESLSRKRLSRARAWLSSKIGTKTLVALGLRKLI